MRHNKIFEPQLLMTEREKVVLFTIIIEYPNYIHI